MALDVMSALMSCYRSLLTPFYPLIDSRAMLRYSTAGINSTLIPQLWAHDLEDNAPIIQLKRLLFFSKDTHSNTVGGQNPKPNDLQPVHYH